MVRKYSKAFSVGLLLAFVFSASAAAQQPIKVGLIYPLSGGSGSQGQHVVKAFQAMADIINANGGVLGRQIALTVLDDESTPAVGISRANELIAQSVAVIFEGWNSPVTLAMQPVINRSGILDITTHSQADAILSGEGNPLAIRMNVSNAQAGTPIAAILAKGLHAERIAWMIQNDAYGYGAQKSQEAALKKLGYAFTKVAVEKFPLTQSDFRIPLTNVRATKPDATVFIDSNAGEGLPALIRQAHEIRLPGALLSAVGGVTPDTISLAGASAHGVHSADIYFPLDPPFNGFAANQRFVALFKQRAGSTPDKNDALAAVALEIWADAANEVNTLEKAPVAKRIRGGTFKDTILGTVHFDTTGQSQLKLYPFEIKDKRVVVQPGE